MNALKEIREAIRVFSGEEGINPQAFERAEKTALGALKTIEWVNGWNKPVFAKFLEFMEEKWKEKKSVA